MFQIQYGGDPTKCIDAGNSQIGTVLRLWDCNGLPQQMWSYDPKAGTIYLAGSVDTSQALAGSANTSLGLGATVCMDLLGQNLKLGTPVQTWHCLMGWGQQWSVQPGITIRVAANYRKCL